MPGSIVSILSAGGLLVLGACSAAVEPRTLTLAEMTSRCETVIRTDVAPTGRQTGDARHDYECRGVHVSGDRANLRGAEVHRSTAIDRALKRGG